MSLEFIERFCKEIIPRKNETKLECINKLTHFYTNGKQIDKIGDLSECKNLKVLYLYNHNINFIDNLSSLTKLTHLYLQWNKIKKIENLNCLLNLKKLYLGNNEISCLENIENLKKLEELHLENQRLCDEEVFQFDQNCIAELYKSLKLLNISKLNMINLKPIEKLSNLEILIATENKFTCATELGCSLGLMPFLMKADLHSCPAQKDIHYREKITAGSYQLETLDNKDISRNTRSFIKRFEQIKSVRRITKSDIAELTKSNENSKTKIQITPSLTLSHISAPNLNISINTDEIIAYKSWNSLNPANKTKRINQQQQKKTKTLLSSDVLLKGTIIKKNTTKTTAKN